MSLIVIDVKATSDLTYTFEQRVIYNTDDPTYSDDWNLRNATSITEVYNASYTFTNYPNGTSSTSIDWIDVDTITSGGGEVYIINENDGHNKVIYGNPTTTYDIIQNNFESSKTNGIIEFWLYQLTEHKTIRITMTADTGNALIIYFYSNHDIMNYGHTSGLVQIGSLTWTEGIWYHCKIDFNVSTHTYDFYLNNILEGNDLEMYSIAPSYMLTLNIGSDASNIGKFYFDAIGYSWDSHYNIGDNIVPLFEIDETVIEVDKYEYRFEAVDDYYDVNDDNPSGWTDIEDGGDHVNVVVDVNDGLDRSIRIKDDLASAQTLGIGKNFDVESGNLNLSWAFDPLMGNPYSYFLFRVKSYDDTVIAIINASYGDYPSQIDLYYYDGTDSILLTTNLLDYVHDFNLFIDYSSDTCVLEHIKNGNFDNRYFFPLITTGKDGLAQITLVSETTASSYWNDIYIDNIGIYVNGTSITTEFAYLVSDYFNAPSYEWEMRKHYLFSFEAVGQIAIYVLGTVYIPEITYISLIRASTRCLGSEIMVNTHDILLLGSHLVQLAKLLFIVYNSNLSTSINKINIEGFRLNDGSSVLYPIHYEGNVNTSESYFYVDSTNKLRFNLIANDNDTEYIEVRFFIFYETTENRSITFKSNINGISKGKLSLNYWGGSGSEFIFPYYEKTSTVKLPQDQVIFTMSIKISDFDITYYDICEGYITNLKLLYTPEGVAGAKTIYIDISNLIMIIIPLIILIAPSLAISIRFGKKAILPMFMVMSIICLATNLIPIWLFFIMILGSGALIIAQYKRGDD